MNAVVRPIPAKSALEALRALRAHLRELDREVEPLRGLITGLHANLTAAQESRDKAAADLESMQRDSTDYRAIAAKKAELETLELRAGTRDGKTPGSLQRAITERTAELNEMQTRHANVAKGIFPLETAVLCERMEEVVDRRRAAKARLQAIEDEIEAFAIANDQLVDKYEAQYGGRAPGMLKLRRDLQYMRGREVNLDRNRALSDVPRPELMQRAQDLRREVETIT